MAVSKDILGQRYVGSGKGEDPAKHMQMILDGLESSFDSASLRLQPPGGYPQRERKTAEFSGSPNVTETEWATWRTAESYIADKAPLLMGYCLGFQLLKKTDDDSRVASIFAFKPGKELVYIPAFLINGEVMGHELMYIVSRDQFVPSDEKWVNYLLSRKPLEPGKIELRERSEIPAVGGYTPSRMTSGLKLSAFNLPPLDPMLVLDALRTIFKEASVGGEVLGSPRWNFAMSGMDLDELFKHSRKATKLAEAWSKTYPVYGRLLNYVLDGRGVDSHLRLWEKKAEVAQRLGVRPVSKKSLNEYIKSQIPVKQAAAPRAEKIAVCPARHIPLHQFRFMPTELIDQIHRDGYHVIDTRDQTKLAAVVDSKDNGIGNPTGPGLYNVFMSDGTFKPLFLLQESADRGIRDCCPSPGRSEEDSTYLLLCSKTKKFLYAKRGDIWVAERTPDPDWFSKLPASNAKLKESEDNYWDRHEDVVSFLITPSGEFIQGKLDATDDQTYYDHSRDVPIHAFSASDKIRPLRDSDKGLKYIVVPKTSVLRRYKKTDDTVDLTPGPRQLWMLRLIEGTVPVSVRKRNGPVNEFLIDDKPAQEKSAALEYLMREHYLSQGTAELLLKEAEEAPSGSVERLREKVAFVGEVPRDKISVTFPQKEKGQHDITGLEVDQNLFVEEPIDSLRATHVPDEEETWPGLLSAETDQSGAPSAPNVQDMQLASQAAASGQKDFVSSQMLMSLLREIDDDGIINKYIPIFEKACDTLGRLYMQVLWRTDAFEDRFGKTQLKEFREMLVSLFQQMGDFICYLRQRDIRPSPVLTLDATEIESGDVS
jgi:hypothetical protein